jgi:cytochrome P450
MARAGIGDWRDDVVVDAVTEARRVVLPLVSSVHFTQQLDLPMPELVSKLRTVADAMVDATSFSLELRVRVFPRRIVEAAEARQSVLDSLARSIARTRRDGGTGDDDLFALLIEIGDAEGLSDDEIVQEAFGHLFNSPDTTVSAFAWTTYLLATHPSALAQVREELDAVAGEPTPEQLPYTIAVLSESLRLYPPSWRLKRRALVDHELDGHRIRAGAHVWASPTVVHRDERWWPHPTAFLPERWLTGARPEQYTYMPFGGGNRKCLGEQLSWRTLTALLIAVLGRWDIAYAGTAPAVPAASSTLQPLGGMPIHVRRRRP